MKYKTRKVRTKRGRTKKGGTKSEERRRTIIEKAIEGKKYEYRETVNNIISKLKKTIGNEYVGPPDFKGTHTWTSKYEELLNIMPELSEKDNDPTLAKGGVTYYELEGLKVKHDEKFAALEKQHIEISDMLSQLPPLPTTKPTKLTVKKSRIKSTQYTT